MLDTLRDGSLWSTRFDAPSIVRLGEVAHVAANATTARIWHGWTTVENADPYQAVVEGEVFPAIMERRIPGLVSAQLMRADDVVDGEVEFTAIIWFESVDSVKSFMGEDYRRAHMRENAKAVLKRFDSEAKHFHIFGYFA